MIYKGQTIRGSNQQWQGVPHAYESTCPVYLQSLYAIRQLGLAFEMDSPARAIAFAYNQLAKPYLLFDVRDCVAMDTDAAATRRQDMLDLVRRIYRNGAGCDLPRAEHGIFSPRYKLPSNHSSYGILLSVLQRETVMDGLHAAAVSHGQEVHG